MSANTSSFIPNKSCLQSNSISLNAFVRANGERLGVEISFDG